MPRNTSPVSGGAITSDGDVLLLRSIAHQLQLTERIAAQMRDPRDPGRIRHPVANLPRLQVMPLLVSNAGAVVE